MSLLSILQTIEKDVTEGIAVAGPIIGTFVPAAGPIITEIGAVLTALEGKAAATGTALPSPAEVSPITKAVATVSAVKQHAAAVVTPVPAPAPAPVS